MIQPCTKFDIPWMVNLSHSKRKNYAKAQKQFWKMAKNSDEIQEKWFEELLQQQDIIALASKEKTGFIIGKIIKPPEVYSAGLTLMIDDFCVENNDSWNNLGKELIEEIKKLAKAKHVTQILIVCGAHDHCKKSLLRQINLKIASEWHVGSL